MHGRGFPHLSTSVTNNVGKLFPSLEIFLFICGMLEKIRKIENSHIILWLFKDIFWVMDFKLLGTLMIAPTIAVALYLTVISRKDRKEFLHSLAVCFWIGANGSWMIGEFFYDDALRPIAFVFFLAGLASIAYYYIGLLKKEK